MQKTLEILATKTGIVSDDFNAFYLDTMNIVHDYIYQPKTSMPLSTVAYSENMESYRGNKVSFRTLPEVVQNYEPVLYFVGDDYVDKHWVRIASIGDYFDVYYSFEKNDPISVFVYHSGMAGSPDEVSRIKLGDSLADFKSHLVGKS